MKFTQVPTPEEIEVVKAELNSNANLPEKPVWCQKFADGSIQFLHTWLTADKYDDFQVKYLKAAQKDPANAERWLQIQILQDCVLWPPTFDATKSDMLQPYPAGVIQGLVTAIMARSGIGVPGLPEVLLVPPPVPAEPTEEEIKEAESLTSFGVFEKPFFVADYNQATDSYDPVPCRLYLYTCVSEAVYRDAMSAAASSGEEAGKSYVVDKCVLWPVTINWDKEPAGYKEALYTSIMAQTGFSPDPLDGSEEV